MEVPITYDYLFYFRQHAGNDTNMITYPDRSRAMEIVFNGVKISADGTQTYGDTEVTIFYYNYKIPILQNIVQRQN